MLKSDHGDDIMEQVLYSKALCNYIISKQQDELLVIFDNFVDNITDPENNTFFIQNEVLDKMLTNLSKLKRKNVALSSLYKGITDLEREIISPLEIEEKIIKDGIVVDEEINKFQGR